MKTMTFYMNVMDAICIGLLVIIAIPAVLLIVFGKFYEWIMKIDRNRKGRKR